MTEQESNVSWFSLTDIENIDSDLDTLAQRTAKAKFKKDDKGLEYCTADAVTEAARPIFKAFGLQNKSNTKLRGNALRLRSGTTTLTARSAYLISVQAWGKNATIGDVELAPKCMAYFKKSVKIKVESDSVVAVFYVVEKGREVVP